jgi:hypothetical protein
MAPAGTAGDDLPTEIAWTELVRRLQAVDNTTVINDDQPPVTRALFAEFLDFPPTPAGWALASPRMKAVDRLRQMAKWGPNWDGERAPAPDQAAIDSAIVLLGFLVPFGASVKVALDCFGKPMIFLSTEDGAGEITVTSPNHLDFVLEGEDGEAGVDLPFDRTALPDRLHASLRAAGVI